MSLSTKLRIGVAVVTAVACSAGGAGAEDPQVYDLTWDGHDTSTVEECVDENFFCIEMMIRGAIGVALDEEAPRLINVDSDIIIPPQLPGARPVISPNLWHNFDLLVGEYLAVDSSDDISMVFRPAEIGGQLRAYTLFVDLTDDGQFLSLTGGIEQSATSPLEPDVRFYVSGRLLSDEELANRPSAPEPVSLAMLFFTGMMVISNHRRR